MDFVMNHTSQDHEWAKKARVFNEMMFNFLCLANKGMDMIRIDAVPYIRKELGTDCRSLPQVHTIVHMIGEIVCPSVILLGEVVMEPVKVVPYFGTLVPGADSRQRQPGRAVQRRPGQQPVHPRLLFGCQVLRI